MRLLSIFILACLLGCVYWLGATVYSNKIESDITDRSSAAVLRYHDDASVSVDGRDVTVSAMVDSSDKRDVLLSAAKNVWGVRKTQNNIVVAAAKPAPAPTPVIVEPTPKPGFDFSGNYNNGHLNLSGLVDSNEVIALLDEIPNALPPSTIINVGTMTRGAADLPRSSAKVETGIAALTQLNRGTLKITDRDFILEGTVSDQDRLDAISSLLATRADDLAPLNVIQNISIDNYLQVTSACRSAINSTMKDNIVNYKVNHYQVEPQLASKLDAIADMVNGVCAGQIAQVLVEGHADLTGGEGYNQGLSERRAAAAQDYLEQRGIAYGSITAFGYGEFRPIASNETEYGRSQNRRTEVHVTPIQSGAINATQISNFED